MLWIGLNDAKISNYIFEIVIKPLLGIYLSPFLTYHIRGCPYWAPTLTRFEYVGRNNIAAKRYIIKMNLECSKILLAEKYCPIYSQIIPNTCPKHAHILALKQYQYLHNIAKQSWGRFVALGTISLWAELTKLRLCARLFWGTTSENKHCAVCRIWVQKTPRWRFAGKGIRPKKRFGSKSLK